MSIIKTILLVGALGLFACTNDEPQVTESAPVKLANAVIEKDFCKFAAPKETVAPKWLVIRDKHLDICFIVYRWNRIVDVAADNTFAVPFDCAKLERCSQ